MTLRSAPLVVNVDGLSSFQNALLNAFEDYFNGGTVTSKVGHTLRLVSQGYVFPPEQKPDEDDNGDAKASETDHAGGQKNYQLFQHFATIIDALVTEFVQSFDVSKLPPRPSNEGDGQRQKGEEEREGDREKKENDKKQESTTASGSIDAEDLLEEIAIICDDLVESPTAAMFTSIPYVAAALDFERFVDLVYDVRDMASSEVPAQGCGDDDYEGMEAAVEKKEDNEELVKK